MYFIRFHQAPNRYTSAWFCVISLKRSIPPGLESGDRWYQLDSLHGWKNISKLFYSLVGLNYCSKLIIRPWKSSWSNKVAGFLGWSMEQECLTTASGKVWSLDFLQPTRCAGQRKFLHPSYTKFAKCPRPNGWFFSRRQQDVYIDVYCISETYESRHIKQICTYETYEDIHTSK